MTGQPYDCDGSAQVIRGNALALAEQSAGVEPLAESFPFGSLIGSPEDAQSALVVSTTHEFHSRVVLLNLPNQIWAENPVQQQRAVGANADVCRPALFSKPSRIDAGLTEDLIQLVKNGRAPVGYLHSQMRRPRAAVTKRDAAFPVDDSSKPAQISIRDERRLLRDKQAPVTNPLHSPSRVFPISAPLGAVTAVAVGLAKRDAT